MSAATPAVPERTRTPLRGPASLRGRVMVVTIGLLAVLLTLLCVGVDLALKERLESDAATRLTDRVALARQLGESLSAQDLVDRLRGEGVTAQLCEAGSDVAVTGGERPNCVTADTAPAPPGPTGGPGGGRGPAAKPDPAARAAAQGAQLKTSGSVLFVSETLPDGKVLTLSSDTTQITSALTRLVLLEVIGVVVALALAASVLSWLIGRALRPLDDLTSLARRIAGGDRGRRLQHAGADTDLGRTADAFDAMLDELEASAATAQRAEHRMREFLGDASHELRTPLAGLQAGAEALIRGEVDDVEREQLAVGMARQTRRAARLVDDLLTMARLDSADADALALMPARVDLTALARAEAERGRMLVGDIDVAVTGEPELVVDADPMRLGQILSNLVDNARHASGPGGRVVLDVQREPGPHLTGRAVVTVTDTGPGVPTDQRGRIFERFARLDGSRSRHTGGAGLGLPIARGLARAHGGDLTVGPGAAGVGAAFRLELPLRAPQGPEGGLAATLDTQT